MKLNILNCLIFLAALVLTVSCKDKDAEKRIAELESRIAEIEGKKTATATPTPVPIAQEAKDEKPEGPAPVAAFAKLEHDFGTINEGQVVEYTFSVKNTGAAPMVIQDAKPSCGCTVPDWTKQPIPPGGTGFVKAKFDSNGKPGIQNKTITVMANTYPKQTVLRFKAMVTPKAASTEGPVK
jgi:hypothetical protein